MKRYRSILVLLPALLMVITGCREEIVPSAFFPRSEHEAYTHSLEQANLSGTALGNDWIEKAGLALQEPYDIFLPFEEEFYWDPAKAEAAGYRFFVRRGLRVEVEINVFSNDSLLLFADLFREVGDSVITWRHVATADTIGHRLEFEPRRDANYILRMQPELLRGGRFRVMIREVPSIGFPVAGRDGSSIQSYFGDPRDGGTREHHGVDIFAARHTPVLAPSNSTVRRIGEGDVGGRYVWLYDEERSMNLYFAHLETQEVTPRTTVAAGQIIGTVGNSGNARYTPPHLHFGIYRNGPIDPILFISATDTLPDRISGDSLFLGESVRVKRSATIRSSPGSGSPVKDTLEEHSVMKITAMTAGLYRVTLPDGSTGYIPGNQVELINDTIHQETLPVTAALLEAPDPGAVRIASLAPGDPFSVLGKYKAYLFGTTFDGRTGWIRNFL